jgi:hypothetical protein
VPAPPPPPASAILATPAIPKPAPPIPEPPSGPFAQTSYRFTTGLRAGEVVAIRGENDQVLLSYRSFASVTGIIAALVSAIVALAGIAAVLFLIEEGEPMRAGAALLLTLLFASCIALLVPRVQVTLYDDGQPALTVSQRSTFPSASFIVSTPNGASLAVLRKSPFSRLGRNRWRISQEGRPIGEAAEESFSGALLRKFAGKFNRRFEENIRITYGGLDAGRIVRRPDAQGRVDVLEITNDALDRRIAVALATLVLGGEP